MAESIRTTTDADGIVTVWFDSPDKPVNTFTPQVLAELAEVIGSLLKQPPAGVIFASAKPTSFIAGADLFAIREMDREQITQFLAIGQDLFTKISQLPMPTVAAINGDCLGGGYELALACTYRVAADSPGISIGLPEVKLGILPGWGGTVRLPRRIGLAAALSLILAGKTLPPSKALRAGMVDEIVRPEALQAAAKRRLLGRQRPYRPGLARRIFSIPPLRNRVFDKARQETMTATYRNYPAPLRIIDVVQTGYAKGPAAGLEAERAGLGDLVQTDAGKNLLRLFFLRQGAKKAAARQVNAKPATINYAAVIGGGTMGAGIAHAIAKSAIHVRLVEISPQAVSAALVRIRKLLDDDVAAGRMDKLAARDAFNRIAPTSRFDGLELADIVIEAAVERMEAKREIFAKLDQMTRPQAVLASNTSSLSIAEMAQALSHPQRVVGLHFFNPVAKMPLVEIVRAAVSDDSSLATAIALAVRLGKTPVLVRDGPGFLVNRVLIPYLSEALLVAAEGNSIPAIDDAMKCWGMPMGPFELLDQIGLDIALDVLHTLAGKLDDRIAFPAVIEQAAPRGWLGVKSGQGFYLYDGKKKPDKHPLNENMAQLIGSRGAGTIDAAAVQWRLVLPMINEAARLLMDGITDSTDTIDLATVLGLGLAPFRGGLMRFADTVGITEIMAKLDDLVVAHGRRFTPAPLLRELAKANRPLSQFAQTQRPELHPVTS